MTKVFEVRNVNQAVAEVIPYLLKEGIREDSRNGKVIVAPFPVVTEYARPCERVIFSPTRNANPFFHLMESLWMLAGRDDVDWCVRFAKNMHNYSDNGKTFWGAYGRRWRSWFGQDQLTLIIDELKTAPNSRRCVLQMWDGYRDLEQARKGGKDVPCNTAAYFDLRGGVLNMTVSNRSNDAIWGAFGANAVHFSVLQEYIAACLGAPVGVYRQFSNNLHIYTDVFDTEKLEKIAEESWRGVDLYADGKVKPFAFGAEDGVEAGDFLLSVEAPETFRDVQAPFLANVAYPVFVSWNARKRQLGDYRMLADTIAASDWRVACLEWIDRLEGKKNERQG